MDAALYKIFYKNAADWKVSPPAVFECENHATGIATYYDLPEMFEPQSFDSYLHWMFENRILSRDPAVAGGNLAAATVAPQTLSMLREDWQAVKDLNPVLDAVKIDTENHVQLYDALRGVASLFNPDDINFYLAQQASGVTARSDSAWLALERKVETRAKDGQIKKWTPSFETLKKMDAALP